MQGVLFNRRNLYCTSFVVISVTRSRSTECDRDYQENTERVHELKVLWKKEKLHSTISKYFETLTFTRLQTCCSQVVTFKMNSSPGFGVDRHFLYYFSFYHELDSFRGCKFLPSNSYGMRTSELSSLAKLWDW